MNIQNIFELLSKGGAMMYPLLICSITAITIIIERCIFWYSQRGDRSPEEVVLNRKNMDYLSNIKKNIINMYIKECLEEISSKEIAINKAENTLQRFNRGMNVLETIITISPMLGILGTVLGIIDSFNALSLVGQTDITAVTGGIAKALITTEAGLFITIVTLIPYNFFINMIKGKTREFNTILILIYGENK